MSYTDISYRYLIERKHVRVQFTKKETLNFRNLYFHYQLLIDMHV